MRCALFCPTPGRQRRASIRWSSNGELMASCVSGIATTCVWIALDICNHDDRPLLRDDAAAASRDQNGSFIPAGIGIPAVAADMRLLLSSLALLTASLNAAVTRSSSISASPSTEGSICTLRVTILPVMVMLTMPPPAWPVTSSVASSASARFRFSCMRWACCIIWAMFPRMIFLSLDGTDGIGDEIAALPDQLTDNRIRQERCFRAGLALAALALVAVVQGVAATGLRRLETDLRCGTQQHTETLRKIAHEIVGAQVFRIAGQRQLQHAIGMGDEGAMCGQLARRALEAGIGDEMHPVVGVVQRHRGAHGCRAGDDGYGSRRRCD